MSDSGAETCCRCCTSFILTSGFTALFIWLSLRTSKPVCSVQDFYVPALNRTANLTGNHTIYFDLKLHNKNKDKGVNYDDIELNFYYGQNATSPSIANFTVRAFYQGHSKHTRRKSPVETRGVRWEEVLNASEAVFRVDLATKVRYKIMLWRTKRETVKVKAIVVVNQEGKKVNKKGIKLKSGASERGCYRARVGLLGASLSLLLLLGI